MDVIIQNFWFRVWKSRNKQNKTAEKGKTQNVNSDEKSILFEEVLNKEIEKYK